MIYTNLTDSTLTRIWPMLNFTSSDKLTKGKVEECSKIWIILNKVGISNTVCRHPLLPSCSILWSFVMFVASSHLQTRYYWSRRDFTNMVSRLTFFNWINWFIIVFGFVHKLLSPNCAQTKLNKPKTYLIRRFLY